MDTLHILIGGEEAEVESISEFPLAINYKLEDKDNFQQKTSDQVFDVTLPNTLQNSKISNAFENPAIEDNTPGQIYRNHRKASIIANGEVILEGKAFLQNANDEGYEYSFYGGNADWIIDLRSATLFDFLKHITYLLTKENMIASWVFDGTDLNLPYVYAPIRYRGKMDSISGTDANIEPTYLKPSVSVYHVIYKAFQSLGYSVKSDFMDSSYFRRLIMPWVWGNYLDSDGTKLQIHKFLAKTEGGLIWFENFGGFPDLLVTNDFHDGGYDNNGDYEYDTPPPLPNSFHHQEWTYNPPHYGILEATFSSQISYDCALVGENSWVSLSISWFHSRGLVPITIKTEQILYEFGKNLSVRRFIDIKTNYFTCIIEPGDVVFAGYSLEIHEGSGIGARANIELQVLAFQLEYFRIPLGGTISFDNYTALKNHLFLDFLGGICDTFDLSMNTDIKNKEVRFEPTHPVLGLTPGYFYGNTLAWSDKKDLSKSWKLNLYSDYEKNLLFKFKPDSADGITKTIQDRHSTILSMGKYDLPQRFKAEKKEIVNRFFAAIAHWNNEEMMDITGIAPQFPVLVPENISNTSNRESGNTFQPKLLYYKGNISDVGGWNYDDEQFTTFPFAFAVNYKDITESDPVLSYCDERMANGDIVKGLLKKFFWQRLAIMRNGQYFNAAHFMLNNTDVSRIGHREFKVIDGIKYELVEITGYSPVNNLSTPCNLRKWVPVSEIDNANTYPSANAYILPAIPLSNEDIKYIEAVCLASDIPK